MSLFGNDKSVSARFRERTGQDSLYNIQSIDNIRSIMQNGLLSFELASKINHTSIAMNEVQKRRDAVKVLGRLRLHQYANLYFDPRNPMLYKRKDQNDNLCILKISDSILDLTNIVVSDRNASSSYAIFYDVKTGIEQLDFGLIYARYWNDNDPLEKARKKSIKCAEVLVPSMIPYTYITGAAVANNIAYASLTGAGFDKKIWITDRVFF